MHGQNGGRTEGGKGVAHQEKTAPQAPAFLLAGVLGLLAQAGQHSLKGDPGRRAQWRQQPQAQLALAGLHPGGEGVDHRRISHAEVGQVAALRDDIAHHQLPVRAQQHVGLLGGIFPFLAGGGHHRRAGDQHLAGQHRQLVGHLAVQGAAGDRHQLLEAAVGVAEDPRQVGVVGFGAAAQGGLGGFQPGAPLQQGHLAGLGADRRQRRWPAAGQVPLAQPGGQAQHRPLVAHHLLQFGPAGPAQAEHRTLGLAHRRQLGRIAHEHQPGAEGVGAAQGNLQQAAVNHRGLIHQHQAQVLEGHCGLLGFLAALQVPLAAQLEAQQPVDGGGIPGGGKAR